ncbi:MAG: hypothetical protein U9Q74_02385 [Gemmatimonadota bacterium]|nr:hypothetical protein [Gemmatimonadota bacterium]
MRESYGGLHPGASADAAARLLAGLAGKPGIAGPLPTLESLDAADRQPPRVEDVVPVEGSGIVPRAVPGALAPGFAAFLDGIQRSVVVPGGRPAVPIVHGTVAAAIRRRRDDRGLETWGGGAVVRRAIFAPLARLDAEIRHALERAGFDMVDTEADGVHPLEILGAAREAVQRSREEVEAGLATRWCAGQSAPLYVDGGVAGLGGPASSDAVVGVVKSHRTAYGGAAAIDVVTGLDAGARTTAFAVSSRRRARVASWYLRLRPGDGADPFDGIVRVEVAEGSFSPDRADAVSRWILAERAPVALPDSRWRVMPYGIRDVEEYLRAVAR